MIIRTKIVATLGPATSDQAAIRRLAESGVDVFRVNFSHGSQESRAQLLANIRAVERDFHQPLAVMADLCGPKIRVGPITGGGVMLAQGQEVVIQREQIEGRPDRISTTLRELVDELAPGATLLLDDGKIRMEVLRACPPDEVVTRVVRGGILASGKGVNLPDTPLTLSALTEKDRADVEWIVTQDFDYVALSFVRRADDIEELRKLLRKGNCDAHIVAKIEKPQAVENIEQIVASADAIMVARGDLGVEMDLPSVPVAQKRIVRLCQQAGKPCIVATQMLESMIEAATPTRAEISDIANAVLDHTDAVMLSGETAVGKHAAAAVEVMNRTLSAVQSYGDENCLPLKVTYDSAPTTAAIAAAVREIISADGIAAVAVYTATGMTARMLSKNRVPCPILAISADQRVVRRMCLYYGVDAVQADAPEHTRDVLAIASRFAIERGLARVGDKMVVVSGRPVGMPGSTNTLVVHTIAD